jgi:hypothetical protein
MPATVPAAVAPLVVAAAVVDVPGGVVGTVADVAGAIVGALAGLCAACQCERSGDQQCCDALHPVLLLLGCEGDWPARGRAFNRTLVLRLAQDHPFG